MFRRFVSSLPVAAGVWLALAAFAPAAEAAAPSTGAIRICSGCDQYVGSGSRYGYVILHSWESGLIPQLKAANPNVKVLVYKDAAAAVSYTCRNGVDDALLPAGVGYCWADANHPDWFLTDASGRRIEFCDYPGVWQMDVGSPAYRQQWAQNVAAEAKERGFDGVLLDDVNQTESAHLCGRTIAKYPAAADYTAAMDGFLAAVAPALRSQGLLAIPNIMIANYWEPSGVALWDRWVSYSSGAVQEYFTKWSHDATGWLTDDGGWHNDWSSRQELLRRTQAAGKIFIGVTYAPAGDARSMRYARASFLADWDGGSSALVFEPTNPEQQDPYAQTWTADIGTPLGPRYRVGLAWRRDFTGGLIVVNPSTSQQTIDLGGAFALPDGSTVTSVTLQSADAAILRPASAPAPPPPPTASAPSNTSLPAIAVSKDGTTLSATAGTWSGSPTGYAYQWERCASDASACSPIAGATGLGYRLAKTDVGFRIRVTVTASNAAGKAAASSAPTGLVQSVKGKARTTSGVGTRLAARSEAALP